MANVSMVGHMTFIGELSLMALSGHVDGIAYKGQTL